MCLPGDLELLEDDRLELSSLMIVSARLDELEPPEDEELSLVLAVELSSDVPHDEIKVAILTTRTNQQKILFILFLSKKTMKKIFLQNSQNSDCPIKQINVQKLNTNLPNSS